MGEEKYPGGRPRHFDSEESLQVEIDAYFEHIKGLKGETVTVNGELQTQWLRHPEHSTITGLAYFLGFESRQSIYDYEKEGQFSYVIKRARLRVESGYEQRLMSTTPAGPIFALKNMGWSDRMDQQISGPNGAPIIQIVLPDGD